ncbi:hypothetical protein XENOCAPTIV_016352 [Xenoophorus captivus]|uniref:Uncharacterized protein n=1 Tax=Xenoophorus captivus TaxID=1517983 RepID=A0ABV0Q619_9TELE
MMLNQATVSCGQQPDAAATLKTVGVYETSASNLAGSVDTRLRLLTPRAGLSVKKQGKAEVEARWGHFVHNNIQRSPLCSSKNDSANTCGLFLLFSLVQAS